jgi:hypothetical protein
MTSKFCLVASYPKSGNTWTRLVFENLARGSVTPISINNMTGGVHGFGRRILFDALAPVNASDLLESEIESFLPAVFRHFAEQGTGQIFVKVHDCAHRSAMGEWLYPPDCVNAVAYLVRHPFDVAVSFAHHLSMTLEETVQIMGGADLVSSQIRALPLPLPQHLGSWSENVRSWLGSIPYRVTLARYEDIHADPVPAFHRLARSIGLQVTPTEVETAVEATRFDRLQKEEAVAGFREKPPSSPSFFRSGQPGSWEGKLDDALRARLFGDHAAMMERLSYRADGTVGPLPQPCG